MFTITVAISAAENWRVIKDGKKLKIGIEKIRTHTQNVRYNKKNGSILFRFTLSFKLLKIMYEMSII